MRTFRLHEPCLVTRLIFVFARDPNWGAKISDGVTDSLITWLFVVISLVVRGFLT